MKCKVNFKTLKKVRKISEVEKNSPCSLICRTNIEKMSAIPKIQRKKIKK